MLNLKNFYRKITTKVGNWNSLEFIKLSLYILVDSGKTIPNNYRTQKIDKLKSANNQAEKVYCI